MSFANTNDLKMHLEFASNNVRDMYDSNDIERMIEPMIQSIGLDVAIRNKFEKYLLSEDGYTIDAHKAFKELGVIAEAARSDKTKQSLERHQIIDSGLNLENMNIIDEQFLTPPTGGVRKQTIGPVFINDYCKIIRCESSGRSNMPIYKYMITKRAFQVALDRAHKNRIYANYFALIVEIHAITKIYHANYKVKQAELELQRKESIIGGKNIEIVELKTMISTLQTNVSTLIEYGKSANNKLDEAAEERAEMSAKIDVLTNRIDFAFDLAKNMLPMWNGKSIFKQQLTNLIDTYFNIRDSVIHLKMVVLIGFYKDDRLQIYITSSNFDVINDRMRILYKRMCVDDEYSMLVPKVVSLITCEINSELAIIRGTEYIDIYSNKTKSFVVDIDNNAKVVFDGILVKCRTIKFHNYQKHGIKALKHNRVKKELMDVIGNGDTQFITELIKPCQRYLKTYLDRYNDGTAEYNTKQTKEVKDSRNDYLNEIGGIIESVKDTDIVDDVQKAGLMDDDIIESLYTIAEAEEIDVQRFEELNQE